MLSWHYVFIISLLNLCSFKWNNTCTVGKRESEFNIYIMLKWQQGESCSFLFYNYMKDISCLFGCLHKICEKYLLWDIWILGKIAGWLCNRLRQLNLCLFEMHVDVTDHVAESNVRLIQFAFFMLCTKLNSYLLMP